MGRMAKPFVAVLCGCERESMGSRGSLLASMVELALLPALLLLAAGAAAGEETNVAVWCLVLWCGARFLSQMCLGTSPAVKQVTQARQQRQTEGLSEQVQACVRQQQQLLECVNECLQRDTDGVANNAAAQAAAERLQRRVDDLSRLVNSLDHRQTLLEERDEATDDQAEKKASGRIE